jgi:hypothetical protein
MPTHTSESPIKCLTTYIMYILMSIYIDGYACSLRYPHLGGVVWQTRVMGAWLSGCKGACTLAGEGDSRDDACTRKDKHQQVGSDVRFH